MLRPRRSTLGWIAGALDPARRAEIRDELVAAAGPDLVEETRAWSSRQTLLMARRLADGRAPVHPAWARWTLLTAASESMWAAAMGLTDRAYAEFRRTDRDGRLIDRMLALGDQLSDEAARLEASAGVRVTGTPLRRWRGDPPDVPPCAPPLADLAAVQRWVREWQVREGRLQPRSARERALAATGERERQAVRDAPDPPPPVSAEDRALLEAD